MKLKLTILACLFAGCQAKWFDGLFGDDEMGVPLTEFSAKDGDYFPPFVQRFFPGAKKFTGEYRSLEEARSGVKMVEIKQLNANPKGHNEANLSWSADGAYLGFEVITDRFRKIMLKDLAGHYTRDLKMIPKGRQTFLDGMVIKSAHSYNAGLRWSRDSTRFAFMSNGGVGEYNIYVGAVGHQEEPISKSKTKDGYANWSPATNEIAFVSGRTGNGDIYLINLEQKQVIRLSSSKSVDIFPEWFPSGLGLVYSSGDALNHDLHIVRRKSTKDSWQAPYPLTKWTGDDLRPTVSPDGRYIAFYTTNSQRSAGTNRRWDIIVVPYVNGKTYGPVDLRDRVVAKDVVIDLNTGPAWSPDSRKLFYVKRDPAVFNPIFAYDLFTGRQYRFRTKTRMNRDILMSKLGILSFRAQVGVWDRVFVALTNQGTQLQPKTQLQSKIHYLRR